MKQGVRAPMQLKEHGRGFVDGLSPGQKAVTLLGAIALVVASVTFVKWAFAPHHARNAAPANGTSAQLTQAQVYDAQLEQRIENMVSDTLGPGHAAVTVAAQLDNSKRSSVTTRYGEVRPDRTVPITQNDAHETLAPGPSGSGTTPSTVYEKNQTQHRNAVDTTVTNSATPPGTLKRLSVSVLLDRAVVSPADVASIWRPAILAAAGIDARRDGANALKVMTVAFDERGRKRLQAQAGAPTTAHPLVDLVERLLALLALALLLFFAWRAIKRLADTRVAPPEQLDLRALESTRAAPGTIDAPTVPARIDEHTAIEAEIADLIERQPDEVAQTLRSWLADRRA